MLESAQTLSARYSLVRRLGAGGHGEVWLAVDRERQGYVALKVLKTELVNDPYALQAFADAVERARHLRHPHILEVAGLQRDGEYAYIAMAYAAGGDLSLLRGRPAGEFVGHLSDIAAALQYAHEHGVVHGDLKTTNVLIASDGTALLSDFAVDDRGSPYNVSPQRLEGARPTPADEVYAFGALLYELLSGYPPYYPQPARERVLHEPVPPLVPRYPAPAALLDLTMQCLSKAADARPTLTHIIETLQAAAAEIRSGQAEAVIAGAAPRIVPPPDETLRPQWRRPENASTQRSQGRRWQRVAAVATLAILTIAAIAVFSVLPRWAQQRSVAQTPAVTPPTASARPNKEEPLDYARLAAQKQEAEELRSQLADRWNQLLDRAVERWASDGAQVVKTHFATADQAFAEGEYEKAKNEFARAEQTIGELEAEYPKAFARQMQAGAHAIAQGDSAKARSAYELAVAMNPDDAAAKTGLKRAESLDQVLALLAQGRSYEQSSQPTQALASYREALHLDPQTQAARDAVARIESQLASDAFGRAMARSYQALQAGQYAAARSAVEEARKVRPQAPELAQALNQIQQAEQTQAIETHLQKAKAFEENERWVEALAELEQAAKLDPNVAAVNESLARVRPRVALHKELELYITQPERLFAASVRQTARASLERARALPEQGPVLRAQVEKVEMWLARAETPVRVSLQSDNATHVTIYRVGELGTFTERSVELAPGRYVAVGKRPGYRDVRREFLLVPGETPPPVVIRCEDPV